MKEIMLRAENIERTYHAGSVDVPALKNCTLEFEQGEFTAIIGKSGSGKSTLLRILGSVDEPDTGSVTIGGKKITGMKDKEISEFRRRQIGYIYQDYSLFPEFTAYEKEAVEDAVLMFCKHCLRYSMGWCPIHQRVRSPYKEPYYLVSNDGKRFRLEFDCKNCQMKVKAAQ